MRAVLYQEYRIPAASKVETIVSTEAVSDVSCLHHILSKRLSHGTQII